MAAFIFNTLTEPFSIVIYDPTGHSGRDGNNFLDYYLLQSFHFSGSMLAHLRFEIVLEKKITLVQIW